MGSTIQALLIIMVLLLGTTLTVIGIQVFFVLRELKSNLKKVSQVVDDIHRVSSGIANSATQATELLEKLKGTLTLVNVGKKIWDLFVNRNQSESEEENYE